MEGLAWRAVRVDFSGTTIAGAEVVPGGARCRDLHEGGRSTDFANDNLYCIIVSFDACIWHLYGVF